MFFEVPRFPERISYNATGGPTWQTEIAALDSGFEYANQNWASARMRYTVGHDARTEAQFKELLAFYMTVRGRFNSFRYKDWADFTATGTEGVFLPVAGDSSGITFQMYKRYTSGPDDSTGPNEYLRKIVKPVDPITVDNGTSVSDIDYTTGIVTMASGTPTNWVGAFDVPVRFDTDVMAATIITRSGGHLLHGWSNIALIEVRL